MSFVNEINELLGTTLTKKDKSGRHTNYYETNNNNELVSLNLMGVKITDLSGLCKLLKYEKKLTKLQMRGANVIDITPLSELKQLSYLDLSDNKITDLSPLSSLNNLASLTLNETKTTDVSPLCSLIALTTLRLSTDNTFDRLSLQGLKQLKYLSFTNKEAVDVAAFKMLTEIRNLSIRSNNVQNIDFLNDLQNLVTLSLGYCNLKKCPNLGRLQRLKSLDLMNNKITEVSPLNNLHSLESLNLGTNKIESLSQLDSLENLKTLWLVTNSLKETDWLKNFRGIRSLSLGNNNLHEISNLKGLIDLSKLHLQDNHISDISILEELPNLREVSLFNNQITNISPLKGLKNLSTLDLQLNPIAELEPWILDFKMDIRWDKYGFHTGSITLFENPLKSPPVQTVKQGKEAIKRYFDKIKNEGIDYIYEAKLILVGEGSAGKTSLQSRLMNSRAALPKEDNRTRGIKIYDWQFKKEKSKRHIAHIWDFGGQDVYYPVHRFFLTENSVFILLASSRQTLHNFDYWVPTIYQFGGNSPIILGQTCHQGNKIPWNDLGYYLSNPHFNIIKTQALPYYELNLPNKNEGLSSIKETIIYQILNLPHYGKGVPKPWLPVRDVFQAKSLTESTIPFETFIETCKNSNREAFNNRIDVEDCAKFLHSIGAILWYSEIEELRNSVVLQPEWAMNAVYRIIDDNEIQKPNRRGTIFPEDFLRLWVETCYEGKHTFLKKMLHVFKIAFPKKHKKDEYIIPVRLLSMPIEKKWQNTEPYLRLEYNFEFMPKGIVNQISAELSRYIAIDEEIWNNAVNFYYSDQQTKCQVEEDFYNRKITLKASGRDARSLVILVMNAIKDISDGYKGVYPQIVVPCSCDKCKNSVKPTPFLYDDLLRWLAEENETVYCNEGRTHLPIKELLYNVGLPNQNGEVSESNMNRTIKVFLASSAELGDDRREFEIFIGRENKKLKKESIFIELIIWEDFIDAMSKTRLQDEYNKAIKESDIFVSLFFTKVGRYTAEEFEKAFGQFQETGKPLVYTYFKEASISTGAITKEINSLIKFQNKLHRLGHFKTTYKNIDNLKNHFKDQLEKLLSTL